MTWTEAFDQSLTREEIADRLALITLYDHCINTTEPNVGPTHRNGSGSPRGLYRRTALRAEANLSRVHEIAVAAHCTLESHLSKLAELRDQAQLAGKYGEAISAEVNRGKALGFYVARSESGRPGEFSNLSDEDLDSRIAALSAIHKAKNPDPQTPAADA